MMVAVARLKHVLIETEGADEEFGKEYAEYPEYVKYADYADETGIQLSRIVINILKSNISGDILNTAKIYTYINIRFCQT